MRYPHSGGGKEMGSIGGGFSPFDKKDIIESIVKLRSKTGELLQGIDSLRGTKRIEKWILGVCIVGAIAGIIGALFTVMTFIRE